MKLPQAIEREQHTRRIGASTAESCALRNAFMHGDRDALVRSGGISKRMRGANRQIIRLSDVGYFAGTHDRGIAAPR